MEKRKLIIGEYDTDFDGLWTLASLKLSDPAYQTYLLEVKGKDGPLDLSTALTDGEPRYGSRTLTARLESSEGTRLERQDRIGEMVNALDGQRLNIELPDYPDHYLTGRLQFQVEYNDNAHAAVNLTAVCDPWLYSRTERVYTLTASDAVQVAALSNRGRRTAVPQAVITGAGASFLIECGDLSLALGPGAYTLPDLLLPPGDMLITYSGSGTAKISYREAVLR